MLLCWYHTVGEPCAVTRLGSVLEGPVHLAVVTAGYMALAETGQVAQEGETTL